MKRRDMMKLVSLVMIPLMPGVAIASPESKTPPLRYKVFTATRPGLNRDVPPGRESLMWGQFGNADLWRARRSTG